MNKILNSLLASAVFFTGVLCAQEKTDTLSEELSLPSAQETCFFIPPSGWELTGPDHLSPRVLIAFIGKSKKGFSPSINLAVEEIHVTRNEYIKAVKALHEADHSNRWRELGKIKTHSGMACLTEIDTKAEGGAVRILQLILVKEHHAYLLTAAALKEEFSHLYEEIHNAFRSLTITPDLLSVISQPQKKEALKAYHDKLSSSWQEMLTKKQEISDKTFASKEFQEKHWAPFQQFVVKEFADLGAYWQLLLLKNMQQELLAFEIPHSSQTDS